jgi:transketolase
MAAGMALTGKKVYTYSIANFPTLRCLEQIRNDVLYHNTDVKIVSVGAGLGYGSLGMSHHGTEDLGVMRCLPNLIVFSPCDPYEAKRVAELTLQTEKPCYVRLGKGKEDAIHEGEVNFEIGKSINIIKGDKVAIFVTGPLGGEALKATKELNRCGISTSLYSFPTIKPIDEECIIKCANEYELILTVEENNIIGGLASAVSEILSMNKYKAVLRKIGLNDIYISEVGNQQYLRERFGLDSESITQTVIEYFEGVK